MKTKIIIILIFTLSSNLLFSQNILNEYLEIAGKNNYILKSKFNEYNASLEKIPQVGTLPDPQLTFGYFILPVETKNGSQLAKVSLSQMFPWFGTLKNKENILIFQAKAKYEDFENAKSNLFFNVKSTYYSLYFIKKGIDITIENIKILEDLKRLVLIKIETGSASNIDELRIEMQLNDLENNLALLKDKMFVNKVKFNKLINVEGNSNIQIPENLWITDLEYSRQEILDSISANNHKIKSLDFIKESFQYKENLSRRQGKPNFIIGADYTAIGDGGRDALMFKIGISIPIYRKKYSAMIKESLIQQQVIEDKKMGEKDILVSIFEKVYSEYTDAERRIILYKKQNKLAKRTIKLLENEYSFKNKGFEEILRMEKRILKYDLELEKAKADKQVAIAFINYLMGKQ